jgi:ELWxxDGT repeat protein
MAKPRDRSRILTRVTAVAGGLAGLWFAQLLAGFLGPLAVVALFAGPTAGALAGRALGRSAGTTDGALRRVPTALALAFSGGFVGSVAGFVLGFAIAGASFIDGSHIEPATVSVVWAGFGWFTGIAFATGLTRGAPPPSQNEAWALRAVALGFLIAGVVVARWVPTLDNPPPDVTLIPLQRAIRLGAALAAVTLLVLAQRAILRRTAAAAGLVASVLILAAVASLLPARGTSIADLTAVGGTLFFTADCGLWTSDGTGSGTVLVKEIDPVPGGFCPFELTNVQGTLYFTAHDELGAGLWSSDGTEAGTVLLKETGPVGGLQLVDVGGVLFFVIRDGGSASQLWTTDGTDVGTVLVRSFDRPLSELMNVGGTLFFRKGEQGIDSPLWRSDGTEAGTSVVESDAMGAVWWDRERSVNIGGTAYLGEWDGASGEELWKSDGTEAGTRLVRDIVPGKGSAAPADLTDVGGTLFFRARDVSGGWGLWASDGTEAGTGLVMRVDRGMPGSLPLDLTNVGGTLFFRVDDPRDEQAGELWTTDGTVTGTMSIKHFSVEGDWEGGFGPSELTSVGETLFFVASDGIDGIRLWVSDGTEAGTVPVSG